MKFVSKCCLLNWHIYASARLYRAVFSSFLLCLFTVKSFSQEEPLCNLSRLILPAKATATKILGDEVRFKVDGDFEFLRSTNGVFTIKETIRSQFQSVSRTLHRLVAKQSKNLPNDDCGSKARLINVQYEAGGDELTISFDLLAEQYGCLIGVQALIADGQFSTVSVVRFRVQNNSVRSFSSIGQPTGGLSSTIPDFDPVLKSLIEENLERLNYSISNNLRERILEFQKVLDKKILEIEDPSKNIKILYRPKITRFELKKRSDTLIFVQERQAEVREGTACKLKELANTAWIK